MAGFGTDRLARRMLQEARALEVPAMPGEATIPSPVEFAISRGIEPDAWQADVLTSKARKRILLCSRQSGKTTTTALAADYEAAYTPGSLVLLVSPSLRQSGELFRTCKNLYGNPDEDRTLPRIVNESALRLELANGSRIIALPGAESTVRGYAGCTLAILDEASRIPDEMIGAIRPTTATVNGRLIALSTPKGRTGWFFKTWTEGQDWERTRITATDCPRITKEFLADEERELGPFAFASEYLCEFQDAETALFGGVLIERAFANNLTPLWDD